jgi:uncharacterized protein YjbI with pentapeptide repeats
MPYLENIRSAHNDPEQLERLYQTAQQENKASEFAADLLTCHEEDPGNVLYAAWHYRLQQAADKTDSRKVNWKLAVPLSIVTCLIFWVLSLEDLQLNFADDQPYLIQIWALIGAGFVIAFLTFTVKKHYQRALAVVIGFLIFGAYALFFSILPPDRNYQILASVHLPVLAWIGAGFTLLGRKADHRNRFAFLIKSIELFVVGGIYVIGGAVFAVMTHGLFQTINVRIPEEIDRLIFPGGIGIIILLATASTYDPLVQPIAQNFRHGLSKLVSTLMRLLMPLTLLVLVIFSYFILQPDNFWIPFNDRDALITYNAMLFAVVFLLVGAIPVRADDLPEKTQSALRKGIIAVAILTVLVSLYAMSATLYRTYLGTITMNRMTVIGWNTINIGILLLLIYKLFRPGREGWVHSAQSAFSTGMLGYIFWTIFVILSVPFIFGQGLATGWVKPSPLAETPVETSAESSGIVEVSEPTATLVSSESEKPAPREMVTPTPTPSSLIQLPEGCPPVCSAVNLAGAYLREVDLRGADLTNANLREADLRQADLRQANLRGADLRGADLRNANLEQASLREANLDNTTQIDPKWRLVWEIVNQGAEKRNLSGPSDLAKADLSDANLREANLENVSLSGANLHGADLTGANLHQVSLHEAKIDDTTRLDDKWRLVWEIVNHGASGRDLSGVNLSQANLSEADLRRADLSRAVLTDTNLSEANLYGADLSGAILTEPDPQGGPPHEASLDHADLASVKIDDTTQIDDKWRLVWEIVNYGAKNRDLSGADLGGADLHEIDLSGASLVGARLDGANLQGANLSGADLNGASLRGVDLIEANLAGANLYEARLSGAYLPADLGGANFRKANLTGVNLGGFDLSGLNLSRADLRGVNLAEADLHGADLSEAHLEGAYLWRADLHGANMRGVYLNDAYLWDANLDGVDLTGAEMRGTIMPDGAIHE